MLCVVAGCYDRNKKLKMIHLAQVAELTLQLQAEREACDALRVEVADMPAALEALGSAQVGSEGGSEGWMAGWPTGQSRGFVIHLCVD